MAAKLRYIEHPAFSRHTPAQWCAVVEQALAIRAAYTGPRTNIFAHIDTALAGGRPMDTIHDGKRVVPAATVAGVLVPAYLLSK
jgi:hypothetical protein